MTRKTAAEFVALDEQIEANKEKRARFYYSGSPHMKSSDPYKGPHRETLLKLDGELQMLMDTYYGDFTEEDFSDDATWARLDAMGKYRAQQREFESAFPSC